jgi:uncharacterized protein with FMN-binding domain
VHLQSSNGPYTTHRIKSRRPWALSTFTLAILAIGGGVAVDSYLNPAVATPTTQPSGTPNPSNSAPADMTVTGDAIQYRFGVIQLEVVRKGGKIDAVNLVQGTASNGREAAFTPLQQYAVQSQGSNFGNLSGATYTTDAFKQALDSAISKLT